VVLLGCMAGLFLVFWRTSILLSIVVALVYIPTNDGWGFLFLCIFPNISDWSESHSNGNGIPVGEWVLVGGSRVNGRDKGRRRMNLVDVLYILMWNRTMKLVIVWSGVGEEEERWWGQPN
jgi:hypothetical protein